MIIWLRWNKGIPAIKHRAVELTLLDYIQIIYLNKVWRVKMHFTVFTKWHEVDGLGKVLREGWAICNGNNRTDNLTGRVGSRIWFRLFKLEAL
jgi:hypothetical protein